MTTTRSVSVALALAAGALGAPAAAGAATDDLTCSASAARVLSLAEPARIAGDCATQTRTAASLGTGLLSTVQVKVTALRAATTRAEGRAASEALADRVRIALPGLVVEATQLRATADAACTTAGQAALTTGGALGSLTINGRPQAVGDGPVELPLGVATLRLNHTEASDGGVTRRALQLSSLLGDVMVGEARAGVRGAPCRPEEQPEPAPDSHLAKAVEDAGGERVGSRDAEPGNTVTYRLTYRNDGDATARDVVVSDALDRQAFASCEPACAHADGAVSWRLGDVPAGEERELALRAQLPAGADEAGIAVFRNRATAQDHTGTALSDEVQVRVPFQPRLVVSHVHGRTYGEGYDPLTTEPLTITEVHAGSQGVQHQVVVRNEGTAPATDVTFADRLADAFGELFCFDERRTGECAIDEDAGAPGILDPAQSGHGLRWTRSRMAVGEQAEIWFGGVLATNDYAEASSDITSRPRLTTAQGETAVPERGATVEATNGLFAYVSGYLDRDGDGEYEGTEHLQHDERVPAGRVVQLGLNVEQWASRAAYDTVATLTVPAQLQVVGDPCADARERVACSYDAGTRTIRLDLGRVAGQRDGGGLVFLARTGPATGPVSLTGAVTSQQQDVTSEPLAFRVV